MNVSYFISSDTSLLFIHMTSIFIFIAIFTDINSTIWSITFESHFYLWSRLTACYWSFLFYHYHQISLISLIKFYHTHFVRISHSSHFAVEHNLILISHSSHFAVEHNLILISSSSFTFSYCHLKFNEFFRKYQESNTD
jgi:hypothetical protein